MSLKRLIIFLISFVVLFFASLHYDFWIPVNVDREPEEELKNVAVSYQLINGIPYLRLTELSTFLKGTFSLDEQEGVASLDVGPHTFRFIKDTPVIEKNGVYLANEEDIIFRDHHAWLPISSLEAIGMQAANFDPIASVIILDSTIPVLSANASEPSRVPLASLSSEDILQRLADLKVPITNAHLSSRTSHLPGAPRDYRNGTHEGIDWYSGVTGIQISESTPVLSMADGIVVRADHHFIEYTEEGRKKDLAISIRHAQTPEYVLDRLRGRSVWIQYEKGVLVRYAHLSSIPTNVKVGQKVLTGQIVGYVGNTGTSFGVQGSQEGMHLHSDILIFGELFWKYLTPEELTFVLEKLFMS